jgi:pectin methylesterase-like acyl-CoA thioesterase
VSHPFVLLSVTVEHAPVQPVVTVATDASGQYRAVQAAVDAAPPQGEVVRIKPGIYKEKIHIPQNGIELRGLGKRAQDVVLLWDDSANSAGGTSKSASVTVSGDDFLATNLTIQNDWEAHHERTEEGSQAVALLITGDRAVFRNVRFLGFQDTLYAGSKTCHGKDDPAAGPCAASRQYYADCYVEGHVDFIFGDAKAAFDRCEIHGKAHENVMLTAQSRLFPQEDSGYLFLNCQVTGDKGIGELELGRPWRAYSTVAFVNTRLKTKLAPKWWSDWDGRLVTSTYEEFNTGPAADTSQRIAGTRQLSAADAAKLTVRFWLAGKDGWNPKAVR